MPLGLCNAPATFQRTVDMLFSGYRWRTCLVYLDDIIVFCNTKEDHLTHVREILTILKDAGFSLKLRKCSFFAQSVDYLGHVIRPGKIAAASKNTEAVEGFKEPRTQTDLRSFLGLCNVYRRFVPNFARTAAPLNALLRKGCPVEILSFTIEQTEALELLKKALIKPQVLRLPKSDLPYSVDTDECNHQVGCALLQSYPDRTRHPIGFWIRSLTPAEKNYSVGKKECLAIVCAVQLLRPYLEGTHFDLYTDNQALKWILSGSDHSGRVARWRLRLLEFDFSDTYKKGAKNTIADAISRLPTYGEAQLAPDTEVLCYLIHGPVPEGTATDEGGAGLDAFCAETSNHTLDDTTYSSQVLEVETECPHLLKTEAFFDEDYDEVDCEDDIDAITATTEAEVTEPLAPLSLEEICGEQMKDDLCQKLRRRSENDPRYVENRHGILCHRAPLDNLEQIVLPEALRRQALLLAQYPRMAAHPGGY